MFNMEIIDFVLMIVIILSAGISIFRGFFREAFSLFSWVIALWTAWKFGPMGAELLSDWGTSVIRLWIARVLILIIALLILRLINWALNILIKQNGLSGSDRAIGMVFGIARGIILAGGLIVILEKLGFEETSWWSNSKLIPYASPVVETIRYMAEDGQEVIEEFEDSVEEFEDSVEFYNGF